MKVAILLITILFSGLISTSADESKDAVLNVRHLAPTGTIFKEAPYENMWYYRTEILNKTKQPLRIVWFESYLKYNGHWYGANVLGKTLRSKEFSSWYTEGDTIKNGVINPGEKAVCDVYWHGNKDPEFIPTKWAFIAVDDSGNDYFVEAVVDREITKYVKYNPNTSPKPTQ